MEKPSKGAQAVVRALRILKLFTGKQNTLTIQDVVKATGLNRTTAFRLLSTLVDEGFLKRREDGSYHLGPELMVLGGLASRRDTLRQTAQPIMQNLVDTVNERSTLEILATDPAGNATMLVVEEIDATHRLSIRDFAGSHLPIYATSTGKALLAHLPQDQIEQIIQQPFESFTHTTVQAAADLKLELNQIRKNGFAQADEELEDGLIALGVPIFDNQGVACASLCLAGPSVRMTREKIPVLTQHLIASGKKISEQLGWRN